MTNISQLQFSLMRLNELADVCHDASKSKGWWENDRHFAEQVANFHAEISEAWEEWRNGNKMEDVYFEEDENGIAKPEGIPIELADLIIRILDTCGRYKIDIGSAIGLKLEYNTTRKYRHGGKLA